MPSLSDCLPGGMRSPSRLSESTHRRGTDLPSALSFHPVSHLQGERGLPARCAANSGLRKGNGDSAKMERSPGPGIRRPSHETCQEGLSGPWVLP